MSSFPSRAVLQETHWGATVQGALWPFQPLGWDYLRPPHLHHQVEVLMARHGRLRLRIGGEHFELVPGHVAFIPPSVEHVVTTLEAQTDFWVLQLDPSLARRALTAFVGHEPSLANTLGWLTQLLPDPPVIELSSKHFDSLEQHATVAWQGYLDAWQGATGVEAACPWVPPWSSAGAQRANQHLIDVFVAALRALEAERAALRPKRLAREALDAMGFDPLLSRHDLCVRFDVSEGHLSRTFPELFGAALVGQRARLRLSTFLSLAQARHAPSLLEACFAAGFGSYAQLHRVFAAHCPFSPRDYLHRGGSLDAAKLTRSR